MNIEEYQPKTGRMIDEENEVYNILDPVTHNPKNTNSDHSAIHYGLGMCLHLYLASIPAADKHVYRFNGPDTLYGHIKNIDISGQGATCAVRLIKGATITNPGTEVVDAIQNLNDNSDRLPQSSVYDSAVAYTGGTIWCQRLFHGFTDSTGNKIIQSGGSFIQNPNIEYVTKNGNTDYILEIENLSPVHSLSHLAVSLFFYEEPLGLKEQPY